MLVDVIGQVLEIPLFRTRHGYSGPCGVYMEPQRGHGKRLSPGSLYSIQPRRGTCPHGNSGVVKSKFTSNLPPRAFGSRVRIIRSTSFPLILQLNALQTPDALSLNHLNHC